MKYSVWIYSTKSSNTLDSSRISRYLVKFVVASDWRNDRFLFTSSFWTQLMDQRRTRDNISCAKWFKHWSMCFYKGMHMRLATHLIAQLNIPKHMRVVPTCRAKMYYTFVFLLHRQSQDFSFCLHFLFQNDTRLYLCLMLLWKTFAPSANGKILSV